MKFSIYMNELASTIITLVRLAMVYNVAPGAPELICQCFLYLVHFSLIS